MSPWMIVSWIGAVCVSILIAGLTISILISVFKPSPKLARGKSNTVNIFTSK